MLLVCNRFMYFNSIEFRSVISHMRIHVGKEHAFLKDFLDLTLNFYNMSSDSDKDDKIVYYQYREQRKVVRVEYWTHPYKDKSMKKYVNSVKPFLEYSGKL